MRHGWAAAARRDTPYHAVIGCCVRCSRPAACTVAAPVMQGHVLGASPGACGGCCFAERPAGWDLCCLICFWGFAGHAPGVGRWFLPACVVSNACKWVWHTRLWLWALALHLPCNASVLCMLRREQTFGLHSLTDCIASFTGQREGKSRRSRVAPWVGDVYVDALTPGVPWFDRRCALFDRRCMLV